MTVDFIIVGAMKAGTSSLGYYLNNHPDIYLPEKEGQFFNDDNEFSKGFDHYLNLFNQNGEKVLGEKTPTYSYQENVPKRIYQFNPNIKLIWIFRNPIDRAYSNYLHALVRGSEFLTFDDAVKNEPERIKMDIWKGYMERSIYVKQVKRYLKYFKKEQMHFLLFEDLKKHPEEELNKVFEFLGVDPNKYEHVVEKRNKTTFPRFPKMLYYTKRLLGNKSLIFKIFRKINTIGKKPGYPKLSIRRKNELENYFIDYNKELQKIINLDLRIWNTIEKLS